ncbi:hypothetical protein AN641_05660 [Candidatus Epulonipiscioides gigas]|nr:hypothetical protein AN641_07780 [Epulopiscium sp. SCG-C07WGA-EpuloA2]ONI44841.1 hypothetical protein AN641_05660 [Epulopiscium sp. SCG-C07WGA-EpuloA2]
MNKRLTEIIYTLIKNSNTITLEFLSIKYNVTIRTIRMDINSLNELLLKFKLNTIELKRGGIICVQKDFEEILKYINNNFYEYKLSKYERALISSVLIVTAQGYITLAHIADKIYVSRSSIIKDLNTIKELLISSNLVLISYPNKGLMVNGNEIDKRWFLFKASAFVEHKIWHNLFPSAQIKKMVENILIELEHMHQKFLVDSSYLKIVKYLCIMLQRNLNGYYLESYLDVAQEKYQFAKDAIQHIMQYNNINFNTNEINYLSILLSTCRYTKNHAFNQDSIKIQLITRKFIRALSKTLNMNLDNDYTFFSDLSAHLEFTFVSEYPQYPVIELIDDVVYENSYVLEAVKQSIHIFKEFRNQSLTQTEINYITIHVCVAIERYNNTDLKLNVIIICNGGVALSQLLAQKLKTYFNFKIVDIISSYEISSITRSTFDLIISTIVIENCDMDVIVISTILSKQDYIRIRDKIEQLKNNSSLIQKNNIKEISLPDILSIVNKIISNKTPELANEIMLDIKKELREHSKELMLHQILDIAHIQLDVECVDWKDAIYKSAKILLDKCYIEERYIDAMIENVVLNGPYIVISKGFAFPHEGLGKGSLKLGMSLIRLKQEVNFNANELDPIKFVCCLSAIDNTSHLKAFFNLVTLLAKPKFKQDLQRATTSIEILNIFQKYEYNFKLY